ncbi:EAL domain-containing protein [Vibrio sinaloensis]|uniref:Histidine kinase n=1 Tax=Photobacterium sp. (strain ATCC 43367) TaxID=379097 RepID=A0A0A5JI00_PHOS4|nr:EAL domain-containing protein [Vibrio sinaloensis]KGY07573.1 histidine kinase [Vibrio sinaloensis]
MSQTIKSIVPRPKITLVSECGVAVESVSQDLTHSLTGAELDELMDDHFKHMIDVLNDGIFYMSDTEHVCFYNPSFYQRFGIQSGHTCLETWLDLVHPMDRFMLQSKVDEHIAEDDFKMATQYRVRCTNGQYVWLEGTAITKTVNGKRFMIGCHKDISDKKLMEAFVQQTSFKDGASGLSNEHRLVMDIDNIDPLREPHSLLYIQVANIRSYLSLYGPQIMRDVLNHIIQALNHFPEDLVDFYRIRSDDFAILVKGDYSDEQLTQLGERISEKYNEAVKTFGYLYGTEISIGIYPSIPAELDAEEAIKIASRTSQFASEQKDCHISVYASKTKSRVDRHFYIERELGNAIKQGLLSIKFQPIICTKRNAIASFEALVRWKCKDIGEIFPDEFISVAEKKGLIVDLGYLVLSKACHFIQQYQATHNNSVRVNVNVSVLQLLNHSFPERVKKVADEYLIDPKHIVLELTETMILDGNKNAADQLNKLSALGFQLSLDDFGAGYSSLNSFFDFPLQQIKIDKSIAWRSFTNPATFEYLSFVIKLCQAYDVDIVIEGIENAQMAQAFTDLGASYLQGYWFSKPLSFASASHYTAI